MIVPEDLELLEFFESEPIEYAPEDGLYVYEVTDQLGVHLVFSFNDVEGSVQARLLMQGNDVALFSQEGAKKLTIEDDDSGHYIRCQFDIDGASSDAQIQINPYISVKWVTLLK